MKITILVLTIFLVSFNILGQDYKDKRFCFEPVFGIYKMVHDYNSKSKILENQNSLGYKFGLLKNIGIGKTFIIRPQVSFSGHKRDFLLTNSSGFDEIQIYTNNEFFIHSSLHFSQNFTNGSKISFPYLVGGASYSLNLNFQDYESKLWFEDMYNISIDAGFGLRFYNQKKHLFALEIIYSYGINNRAFFGDNQLEETFNREQAQDIFNQINKINTHFFTIQFLL